MCLSDLPDFISHLEKLCLPFYFAVILTKELRSFIHAFFSLTCLLASRTCPKKQNIPLTWPSTWINHKKMVSCGRKGWEKIGHINSLITWSILWHRHLWFLLSIFLEVACFYHSGALLLEVEDAVKSGFIAVPVKYGSTKLGPSWPRNDSLSRWVMYWPVCRLANRALSPLAVARRQMADKWAVFSGRAYVQTSGLGPWFCGSRPGSHQVASGPQKYVGL